jgi:hypothetical protein
MRGGAGRALGVAAVLAVAAGVWWLRRAPRPPPAVSAPVAVAPTTRIAAPIRPMTIIPAEDGKIRPPPDPALRELAATGAVGRPAPPPPVARRLNAPKSPAGLEPAPSREGPDPIVQKLRENSVSELRLYADLERATGKPPSEAVRRIVERRRAGDSRESLQRLATETLRGRIVERATVLRWLEQGAPPAAAAPPSVPGAVPSQGVAPAPVLKRR